MDESTPTDATDAGATPTVDDGPKPDAEPKKVPDEAYVKALRKEAADNRKALADATKRIQEIEDRDKSEVEKATERATASEARAVEAEARLLRLEVAAARGFNAQAVALLHGSTREEIDASADALAVVLKANERTTPGFDGGARTTAPESKSPEAAHNDWLLNALGRKPT